MNEDAKPLDAEGREIVAWMYELANTIDRSGAVPVYGGWVWHVTWNRPNVPEGSVRNLTALVKGVEKAELPADVQAMAAEASGWNPLEVKSKTVGCFSINYERILGGLRFGQGVTGVKNKYDTSEWVVVGLSMKPGPEGQPMVAVSKLRDDYTVKFIDPLGLRKNYGSSDPRKRRREVALKWDWAEDARRRFLSAVVSGELHPTALAPVKAA